MAAPSTSEITIDNPSFHHEIKLKQNTDSFKSSSNPSEHMLINNAGLLPGVERLIKVKQGSNELYTTNEDKTSNLEKFDFKNVKESINTIYHKKTHRTQKNHRNYYHKNNYKNDKVFSKSLNFSEYNPENENKSEVYIPVIENDHENDINNTPNIYIPLKLNLQNTDVDSDDTKATICGELNTPLGNDHSEGEDLDTPTLRRSVKSSLKHSPNRYSGFRKSDLFNPNLARSKYQLKSKSREFHTLPNRINSNVLDRNSLSYSQNNLHYQTSPSYICKRCQRNTCPMCQQSTDDQLTSLSQSVIDQNRYFSVAPFSPVYSVPMVPNQFHQSKSLPLNRYFSNHSHYHSHSNPHLNEHFRRPNRNFNFLKIEYQRPVDDEDDEIFQTEIEDDLINNVSSDNDLQNVKTSASKCKTKPFLNKTKLIWITDTSKHLLEKLNGVDLNILAAHFKSMLDEQFGKTWHCVVSSESFGSNIATVPGALVSFEQDNRAFLIWKT